MSNTNPPGWGNQPQGQGWQQPQGPGYYPPQPPPKKKTGKIIGFGCLGLIGLFVVIIIVVAVAASGGSSDKKSTAKSTTASSKSDAPLTSSGNKDHPPVADVRLSKCTTEDLTSTPQVTVTFTNHTSKPSDYNVQVEFLDAKGNRLDDGYALENKLAPGQTASDTAAGLKEVHGTFTCKVVSVDRNASLG